MINTDELREGFAKLTSISVDSLKDDTVLETLVEWDSMAIVGTAAMIFEMTNQSVNPEELEELKTYGDVVRLAQTKAGAIVEAGQ